MKCGEKSLKNPEHYQWLCQSKSQLRWNIALWEQMLRHQKNWRIWNSPNLIDSLFVPLICVYKNTRVFHLPTVISKTHATSNCNHCSFSHSINPLLAVSLSGLSALLPIQFYLFVFHINTLLIWWDGIIVINWFKVTGCFIWGSLTILAWIFTILKNLTKFPFYCFMSIRKNIFKNVLRKCSLVPAGENVFSRKLINWKFFLNSNLLWLSFQQFSWGLYNKTFYGSKCCFVVIS